MQRRVQKYLCKHFIQKRTLPISAYRTVFKVRAYHNLRNTCEHKELEPTFNQLISDAGVNKRQPEGQIRHENSLKPVRVIS
jgi:hypothetical protein